MVTTAAQKKTRANLLELLESFSQCGTPTLSGAEIWQRVDAGGKEEHLEIGETVKMATHEKSFADQLHFWKQVGTFNMSKKLIHGQTVLKVKERVVMGMPPLSTEPPSEIHHKIAIKRL